MNSDEAMERVCRMPFDFFTIHTKSMVQLAAESGIDAFPAALTVANVAAYLMGHPDPDLVWEWLKWSSGRRVPSGWYFERRAGGYIVHFHPKGETLSLSDPVLACAEFTVRVVKELLALVGNERLGRC